MKRLLLPLLLAISLVGSGCLTSDYNLRVLYDTDRAYIHPDSTQSGMKWRTPTWRAKNLKYWSSAGVIVTNWYNVFEENDWLKYAIANGFEGTVLIQQNMSAVPIGLYTYPASSFGSEYYLLAVSQYPSILKDINGNLIVITDPHTIGTTQATGYSVMTMPPSMMNTQSYREALAQLYVNHIQSTMTELGITSQTKVNFGVMLDEYGYSDWNWGNELTALAYEFDPTGGTTNWNSQTPEDRHTYLTTPQSNLVDAFYDAGVPVVVKGDRLETELLSNTDLLNGKLIGYMFDDVTTETLDNIKATTATIRSYESTLSQDESLLLIAGIKRDVYRASKPTIYATLVRGIVTDGMYFTSGSDGVNYWRAPAYMPGDWWVRTNRDSNWQSQAPTYASYSVSPRNIMTPMDPTFGVTPTNTWTCSEPVTPTRYIFPTNTAATDSGSVDFGIVYDEGTSTFHIIQIPGAFYNWGGRLQDRAYTDTDFQQNRLAWFEHFTSTDLVTWTEQPHINMYDATYAKTNVWAPHIIKDAGVWYMYYTATDATVSTARNVQRIMVSTSTDLYTWSTGTLVLEGDDREVGIGAFNVWTNGASDWDSDCRDAHVIRNETNDGWLMFVSLEGGGSAYPNGVGTGGMVIGIARSTSLMGPFLLHDYVRQTTVTPQTSSYAESPQVWVEGGTYYLQLSTNDGNVGWVTTSTTPSNGYIANTGSWSSLSAFPYKAPEMLTMSNGQRIMAYLDCHPSLNETIWGECYMTMHFKRYDDVGTFSNLTAASCYDGSPFFTAVTRPDQPTGVGVVATSSTSTKIYWTPATYGDVFSYNIYRGTSSGSEVLVDNTTDMRRYLDTGLTDNQIYYYKVAAVNYDGTESVLSSEVSATP